MSLVFCSLEKLYLADIFLSQDVTPDEIGEGDRGVSAGRWSIGARR